MSRERLSTAARFGLGLALLVACVPACGRAQSGPDPARYYNLDDFSSERLYATGDFGVGARAMGMGGAYLPVADDATALQYNPAGLAQVRRIEIAFGMRHQDDESRSGMFGVTASAPTKHTGLDHLAFAYPYPTYRGSVVAGLGLFRVRSCDLVTARADRRQVGGNVLDDAFRREQKGGVWRLVGGLGVDLLQDLSFGASLSYWRGRLEDDQYRAIAERRTNPDTTFDYTDRLLTGSDLDGFSFDLGLLGYVGDIGRLALTLHSPTWLRIQGDASLTHVEGSNGRQTTNLYFIDDHPRLPWSAGLGGSLGSRGLVVAGELRYTPWDEIDLDVPRTGSGAPLPGQPSDYSSQLSVRGGVELALPRLPVRLRGGYSYEPLAYDLLLGNPARAVHQQRALTFGAGVLLADSFTLDVAAVLGSFERADAQFPQVYEKLTERHAFLSGAYRF